MHNKVRKTAIILLWLTVWQVAAVWIGNRILMVGPVQVLCAFWQNVIQPDFLRTILTSLARIGLGFFLALFGGLLFGALGYRYSVIKELLTPVMAVLKSIPVASFVVLLLIWFGSGRLSLCISFLIVFPNVYVNTIAGLESADAGLLEMAQVYGMNRRNRFFYIYRPALMPYLDSCLKISLGMSWKSGVAAEVIGLPDHSLGERLYMSKIYLDTAGLFAWTLTIILVSFLFEKAVLRIVKAYADWKPYPVLNVAGHAAGRSGKEALHMVRPDTIDLSHIYKSYGEQQVLRDYSMNMIKGQRYVLMAPSGSGKTTLLKILTGLDNTDAGEIAGMPGRVGMVFQEDRLCEEYDSVCNIMLGMERHGQGIMGGRKGDMTELVRKEAALILPEDCLAKPVRELSGGMRRRVALLRAVMSESDMLILDEPFAGLDEENRILTAEYLLENLRGRTLLMTTHREEDAELLKGIKVTLVFSESLCYNA